MVLAGRLREQIPENIPREDRIIDVPEEKRQGMKLIGYARAA
jgi:hypothetical protein